MDKSITIERIDRLNTPAVGASISSGMIQLSDGETVDLVKIQATMNYAFQELGESEFAEAADLLSKLTGMEQGPYGEFFLKTSD